MGMELRRNRETISRIFLKAVAAYIILLISLFFKNLYLLSR